MRKKKTRLVSLTLVLSLCLSLWNPGLVSAQNMNVDNIGVSLQSESVSDGATDMDTNTDGSTQTGNTDENVETEVTTTQKIVFVNDENQELDTASAHLKACETLQLNPRIKEVNEDGKYVDDAQFTYTSSDESVATVSDEGLITAKSIQKDGEAVITVTWKNPENGLQAEDAKYTIMVSAVEVASVELGLDKKTLVINDTYTLKPEVSPAEVSQEVVYSSSDETVVTVSQEGVITAIKAGSAIITVASKLDETKKDTIEITVIDVPVSIEFDQTAYSVQETQSIGLTAQLVYASGKKEPVDNKDLTYQSQNEAIVTVDANGVVTALDVTSFPLSANVVAIYSVSYEMDGETITKQISGICQVTVVGIPVSEIRLENTETSITMKINDKYTLLPVVLPENASVKDLVFKSSDTDVAKVGKKGVITAKGIGDATITVSSAENSEIKVQFQVKVYQTEFHVNELGADGNDTELDVKQLNKILKYASLIDETINIYIPAGTYFINDMLTIYSDTNLYLADDAVIKRWQSAAGKHMLRSNVDSNIKGYGQCKNVTISGGVWDGNSDGSKDANCIYIGHAENITIRDTVIKNNSGSHLIELAGVKNALIENVELYGYIICKENGYTASQADKEAIQIDYCGSVSTPAMKPHDLTACQDITIRNCKIHDYMSGIGTHTSVSNVYSKNILIENNQFTNITNACINLRNFKDVTINKNKASGFTTFLYASESTGTVTNNTIKNDSFDKMTNIGLRAMNGITVSNYSKFTIKKNTINKATSNGICVWNGSTATIKNNKIKSNKLYGIRTSASTITLAKNTVSGNKKGHYDTYKDAKVKSSDDIRAYYVSLKAKYKYTGKAIKPKITIKGLNKKYYKVSYKNNKKVGKATITIKGKGKVKKTLKLTFKITKK